MTRLATGDQEIQGNRKVGFEALGLGDLLWKAWSAQNQVPRVWGLPPAYRLAMINPGEQAHGLRYLGLGT